MKHLHVKRGDVVTIITGKDKGKSGRVLNAFPRKNTVLVEGVNIRKKHERPKKTNQKGQIVEKAMPIHVSNVRRKE